METNDLPTDGDGAQPRSTQSPPTVLKNENPAFVSDALSNIMVFFENYGWFVLFFGIIAAFLWSKLQPLWIEWKNKQDRRKIQEIDPQRLARTQENMVLSRRRMQEEVNAKAAQRAEKMKEMDAQKRKEKIDDWENTQQGRSRSTRTRQARNDYNPLSGSSSGSSYRPPKRGNIGGGG